MTENGIGKVVVDAALKVHRKLGPGLLETVYEVVLARELESRGLRVERQVPVPIIYEGLRFEEGFRADIIVGGKVILELKSVAQIDKVHAKQVFTYLKLKRAQAGVCSKFWSQSYERGDRAGRQWPVRRTPWRLCVFASWRETRSGFEPPRR